MSLVPPLAVTDALHLGEAIPPLLAGFAYVYLYALRARELSREGRPVQTWRVVSFVGGRCSRWSCRSDRSTRSRRS